MKIIINPIFQEVSSLNFEYYNPKSMEELLNVLDNLRNYYYLAGGTDIVVKMKDKIVSPQNIVDLNDVQELKGISSEEDHLNIGPLATHTEIEESDLVKKYAYVLAEAAAQVGSPQIRNIGTVGGNIGNASPAADTVPALLVLDTTVQIESKNHKEEKNLLDIFKGPGKTFLTEGQVITKLKVRSIKEGEGAAFVKMGKRKALAISVINCAVWLRVDKDEIVEVRIAFGSVAPTPIRLLEVEKWLKGQKAEDDVFKQAAQMAQDAIKPIDDIRSTAEYRSTTAASLVYQGLKTALQRAREEVGNE